MTHQENIQLYLKLGGSSKIAKDVSIPNPKNVGKLAYLLSQLSPPSEAIFEIEEVKPSTTVESVSTPLPEPPKTKSWGDFISQYPVSLHATYNDRLVYWLKACSLKIKLNALHPSEEKQAYALQKEILESVLIVEKSQTALQYYLETKRELPSESEENYNGWSQSKLITKRNNLRSNISQRKNTIQKKQSMLPNIGAPNYLSKLSSLQNKVEELRQKEIELEKLSALVKQ